MGDEPIRAGMILSNEPGYYKTGEYGIRIENLVLVEPREIAGAEKSMLGFTTLTLAPLDRALIDVALLTPAEVAVGRRLPCARCRGGRAAARRRRADVVGCRSLAHWRPCDEEACPEEAVPVRRAAACCRRLGDRCVCRTPVAPPGINTAYDVTMTTIDGKPMPFSQYKGKVLLVVNTASFCGFTPQYEALEKAQNTYKAKGFTVIGVPSGDFMGQEYKTNAEIKQFCESKFGINFPLSEKSTVKGANATPFFAWAAATLGSRRSAEVELPQVSRRPVGQDRRVVPVGDEARCARGDGGDRKGVGGTGRLRRKSPAQPNNAAK